MKSYHITFAPSNGYGGQGNGHPRPTPSSSSLRLDLCDVHLAPNFFRRLSETDSGGVSSSPTATVSFGDGSARYRVMSYRPAHDEVLPLKIRILPHSFPPPYSPPPLPHLDESSRVDDIILHYQQAHSPQKKRSLLERAWLMSEAPVEIIAQKLLNHGIPSHAVTKVHLVSSGFDGFLDAANKYDPQRHVRFLIYASYRIKGAMQDYLRSIDPAVRNARSTQRAFEAAQNSLSHRNGRPPRLEEVLAHGKISRSRYTMTARSIALAHPTSLTLLSDGSSDGTYNHNLVSRGDISDHLVPSSDGFHQPTQPHNLFSSSANRDLVGCMMNELTPQQKKVVTLYYFQGFTMKEVGDVLDLSESRVCQINSGILRKLRAFAHRKGYLASD